MGNSTGEDYITLIITQKKLGKQSSQFNELTLESVRGRMLSTNHNGILYIYNIYIYTRISVSLCCCVHSLVDTSLQDASSRKQGKLQDWNKIIKSEQNTTLHSEHVILLSSPFLASLAVINHDLAKNGPTMGIPKSIR